jgi:hypothetical protein
MTYKAYLAEDVVNLAAHRIKETFLNYDPDDDTPAQDGLAVIDAMLKAVDRAYRRLVPVHEDGLIGYRDCEHHCTRWIGRVEEFETPVPEIYVVETEEAAKKS